jgi:hypothetical protein
MNGASCRPSNSLPRGLFAQGDRVLFAKYQRSFDTSELLYAAFPIFSTGLSKISWLMRSQGRNRGSCRRHVVENDISELPDLEFHAVIADYIPCDFSSNSR